VFRISAIQKLKANHNNRILFVWGRNGVPNISYSEIESKSQLIVRPFSRCFRFSEYQLFRNWKQITTVLSLRTARNWCSEYQLFRNWKQITTLVLVGKMSTGVFRISAIQKLKANHNCGWKDIQGKKGVPNISYSEIESKSQQHQVDNYIDAWCSEYQLFRNWKQITTPAVPLVPIKEVFRISAIQKLKANHNQVP